MKAGDEITVSMFEVGQLVDVTGTSKGKGFSGTIKRHNFGAQRTSHGNSRSHRVPGSIGMAQDLVACSLVNVWQVNTVTLKQLFKNWKLYVLMLNANSCWLKVLFRVRLTATSWFVLA